jgi:pyruvate/2-oxoglutarate dehydrogenase complex dihydrolipoamide acyltransferase (E2) component
VVGKQEDAAAYHRGGAVPAAPAAPVVPAAVPTAEAEADDEYLPIIKGQTPARPKTAAGAVRAAAYPAMPNAKMLARERGIDLTVITPSNGQFIKRPRPPRRPPWKSPPRYRQRTTRSCP